jgi:hypothetical protein
MRRRHYTRDGRPYRSAKPVEMASRRAGYCCGCGQEFGVGAQILWEPSTGRAYAMACSEGCGERRQHVIAQAERDQAAAMFDEEANATMNAM